MQANTETQVFREQLSAYVENVARKVTGTDFQILSQIAAVLVEAKQNGAAVFTAGNGGSAATASHMANDFTKGCRVYNREGFKIHCLSDPNAIVTCLANDFCYEDVFSIQLKTLARKGDVLVVFSGSGNSPNIVRAVETAKKMGVFTIGFSGRDGGELKNLCDLLLIAPTDSMEELEDMHLMYEHALTCSVRSALEDLFGMEILHYPAGRSITAALFDFDGTISLIREGWQEIMTPYFIEVLERTPNPGPSGELHQCARDFIDRLTGKQTIAQCMRLDEEVIRRGGEPVDPLVYKKEYLRRLEEKIRDRKEALQNQTASPSSFLVPGARELILELKNRGIKCYLASGTDEADVLREAELLGISDLFDGGIYGAKDETTECSKEIVIQRIIQENQITGENLVSFGDGYVEIELVNRIGGYTFGLASDEVRRKGINAWKRERLLSVDADCIIPDFTEYVKIVDFIV